MTAVASRMRLQTSTVRRNERRNEIERLVSACDTAIARLADEQASGIAAGTFAATGEALFWLYALSSRRRRSRLSPGLIWARHQCVRGNVLTGFAVADGSDWQLTPGRSTHAAKSMHVWLPLDRIEMRRPAYKLTQDAKTYERDVAGRPVLDVLRDALAHFQ